MRLNSMKLFIVGAFALTAQLSYAQVEPTDSTNNQTENLFDDEPVSLRETLIIGRGVIDLEEDRKTPVAVTTIGRQEIQDKVVGNVEFPEIMQNSPSVTVSDQSSGFGDGKAFVRGFTEQNTAYLLNGQPINGMEDGNIYWSNWSAMTEVANAVQIQRGLGSSKLAISSVGGTVNIVTKATDKREGGFARFVVGNDSYLAGTVSYNTGLKNKWGFSVLLNHWQAHRKWAYGTGGQGQAYFVSVGYQPNENHNFNFMIFGAPQWHDQNYSTKSLSQWADGYQDRKYNTTYGYYKGEGKNLRRNYYHKPVANLNWDWTINEKANLSTVLYASVGTGGGTSGVGRAGSTWADGRKVIDFDKIEANNLLDPDGIGNNGGAGVTNGAIRASVNNHFWYGAVTNFGYDTEMGLTFNLGADVRFYEGQHHQQMIDLFGLKGWSQNQPVSGNAVVVTETFSTNPWKALFKTAGKDQRTSRDYREKINYQGVFGQVEYAVGGFSIYGQGAVSNQFYQKFDTWNYGGVENASEKVNKTGWNIKGGVSYTFLDDHSVFFNTGRYSRQPFLDNVFVYNTVDLQDPEIENEEITGYEAGYRFKTRNFNLNINAYRTEWGNRFLYLGSTQEDRNGDGVLEEYDQYATGLSQIHKGIEVDFDTKITRQWMVRGYVSYGDWRYKDSTPFYELADDQTYQNLARSGTAEINDYKVGNAAQFTFGMGTKVEIARGFSMDTDFNYYAKVYENINVLSTSAPQKVSPFTNVDLGASYEFKMGTQKLRFRGNVKNVLNDIYVRKIDRNGYGYNIGRTWNASIQYSF